MTDDTLSEEDIDMNTELDVLPVEYIIDVIASPTSESDFKKMRNKLSAESHENVSMKKWKPLNSS